MAWGRVVLLERIREHGSINKAAKSMGMGYRHAWTLVDKMNRDSPKPLVRRVAGGKHGGGTVLTPEGEALVEGFWKLVEGFRAWMAGQDPRLWKPGSGAGDAQGRRTLKGKK
jgi:molybdate transport system regulatory protein